MCRAARLGLLCALLPLVLQLCACARLPALLHDGHRSAWNSHLEGGGQQVAQAAVAASTATDASLAPPSCQQLGVGFACALAGGWCPPHDLAITQQGWAVLNASSSSIPSSSSSSHGPDEPEPPAGHKPLRPLSRDDAWGLAAAGLALLLAASGGIGGGAILVPLYLMVLGEGF